MRTARRAAKAVVRWLSIALVCLAACGGVARTEPTPCTPTGGANPSDQLAIARRLFAREYMPPASADACPSPEGFDAFAFGLAIADAWIVAGHPTRYIPGDPTSELVRLVLHPPEYDRYGKLPHDYYGESGWVQTAFASDPQGTRLVEALARRDDPWLMGVVLYSLRIRGVDARAILLRALEPHPSTWRLAMVLSIDQAVGSEDCDEDLLREANRVWREAAALRGTALHAIVCRKEGRNGGDNDAFFAQLPQLYGDAVDAPTFAAFLDDGPGAMAIAASVWPALSKGWSRAAVIAPRLDAFLRDPKVVAGAGGEPMRTLRSLGARLCGDGASEVAELHQALVERAATDAATARALAKVIEETRPGLCPRRR